MRQFITEQNPDSRGILKVSGKNYRYFRQILRVKVGDMIAVRLTNGSLQNFTVAKIEENSRQLELQICAQTFESNETITRGTQATEIQNSKISTDFYLFQFAAKPAKMDVIIRQAVECGVTKIIPIAGIYSQKENLNFSENRKDRIDRIIKEARQQSGSPVNTICEEPVTLEQAVKIWKEIQSEVENQSENSETLAVVLYERTENTKSLENLAKGGKNLKKVALVVGSEGGISPEEIKILIKNGFNPIHFETNILRCETAALYGIAVVQSLVSLRKSN